MRYVIGHSSFKGGRWNIYDGDRIVASCKTPTGARRKLATLSVESPPAVAATPVEHYAELFWSDLLGGGSTTIGPFPSARDLDDAIESVRDGYPGDHWPAVRKYTSEVEG